jgi:hypothetical protein
MCDAEEPGLPVGSSKRGLMELVDLSPLVGVDPSRGEGRVFASDASSYGGGVCVAPSVSSSLFWSLNSFSYYKGRCDLLTPGYTLAQKQLLDEVPFPFGFGWRWRDPSEIIMVKEARALVTGFQRVVWEEGGQPGRHLAVNDNQPATFAFCKGTSHEPSVNALITRVGMISLALGATLDLTWCCSASQPADAVSRCCP